jgi:hypothetical protein
VDVIVLHLARTAPPPGVVADADWLVALPDLVLAAQGAPPVAPGRIDHDQLVALIAAADRVVTW